MRNHENEKQQSIIFDWTNIEHGKTEANILFLTCRLQQINAAKMCRHYYVTEKEKKQANVLRETSFLGS